MNALSEFKKYRLFGKGGLNRFMDIRKIGYYPNPDNTLPEGGGIHASHEILCFPEGRATVEWLGQSYAAEGPAVFLFSPNTPHTLGGLSASARYLYVEFEPGGETPFPSLPRLLLWNGMQENARWRASEAAASVLPSLHAFEQLARLGAHDKSLLLKKALEYDLRKLFALVGYMLEQAGRNAEASETAFEQQRRTVEAVKRYLETNYRQELTLARLAGLVHLNGSYLIRLFKRHLGQTPFQYLSGLRMNAAVSYLENSGLSVQRIAEVSGFRSIHYFSQAFKIRFGVSPARWRERSQGLMAGEPAIRRNARERPLG